MLVLQDGRTIVVRLSTFSGATAVSAKLTVEQGVLSGFDQRSDIILSQCKERIYSMDDPVEEVPLGLYLGKGDQMCVLFVC